MKNQIKAALLLALLTPAGALGQTNFDGTWKVDVNTLPLPKTTFVWVLQNGRYQCKTCAPPIDVKVDGQDQPAPRPLYDTISVAILDDHTVREIEKKNGQTVSDEKFTVSADGKTVTDEFAKWKMTAARVAKGPAGSHALSGSWQNFKIESLSDKELLVTFRLENDTLSMTRPTGQSYAAKLDGPDSPYRGDTTTNGVSVKRIDANTIEETDKLNGKVVSIARMTVAPDGKSMTISVKDMQAGTTSQFKMNKQ
jgi:hypothetical protein